MNRKQLIAHLKRLGYKGTLTREAIEAWLTENQYDTTFEIDGKSVTLDQAWGQTKKVVITPTAGEEIEVQAGEEDGGTPPTDQGGGEPGGEGGDSQSYDGPMSGKSVTIPATRLKALEEAARLNKGGKVVHAPAIRSARERAIKAYNQRAASEGRYDAVGTAKGTSFADGERAEAFGAVARLKFASMYPGELGGYSQKATDIEIVKALGEGTNSLGGALVFDEFRADLIELKERTGVLRGLLGVTQMSKETLTVPRLGSDVVGAWLGENAAISDENKPTFDNVQLVVQKYGVLVRVSNELMNDAALSVGDIVARSMARRTGEAEDDAGINGDATSTYGGIRGFLNAIDSNAYHTTTNTTWAAITWDDLVAARAKLSDIQGIGEPKFLCSAQFFHSVVERLIHAAGGQTMQERINGFREYRAGGYEWVICPKMPQTLPSSKIACLVGYFSAGAKFGECGTQSVAMSDQRYFEYDQIAFRTIERVDINVHERGASGNLIVVGGLKTA